MRPLKFATLIIILKLNQVSCYWDEGTTTLAPNRNTIAPRVSMFKWDWCETSRFNRWFYKFFIDYTEDDFRRRASIVAGITIDNIPLGVATILNFRTLVTSYNYLDPYMNRQSELRIWALGRAGEHFTPYRYRVYSVIRVVPPSTNPEHCHGIRCTHQPRHDVSIIISLDQIYINRNNWAYYFRYAWSVGLASKYYQLSSDIWISGSGFVDMEHVYNNYRIKSYRMNRDDVVDCSKYLPKWWGKFICLKNNRKYPGIQNGLGFYTGDSWIFGLGCFEIRYNEERIFVFTDLRYYMTKIRYYATIRPGSYYEYAYPQWGIRWSKWFKDSNSNDPYIPYWQVRYYEDFGLG